MNRSSMAAAAMCAALFGLASAPATAGKYDGSAAMICTVLAMHECAAGELCHPRAAEHVNFAPRFRVDAGGKRVHNLETDKSKSRESTIQNVSHQNGKLVLSGAEVERGWVVVIHEDTGRLSGAVSGDGDGFVIFGQCAVQ
jgi:hypothetical protein